MLSLTETKLKGNGEVSWCMVNGIIAGTLETARARSQVLVEVMSITDLVLVKKVMLCYVQDMRPVRGMERDLLYPHVLLCIFRFASA